jgi:transposase
MKAEEKEYLDADGVAELLGVSTQTVRPMLNAWRESGGKVGLPHAVIGSKLIRTTREDVRRYYEGQKKATAGGVRA